MYHTNIYKQWREGRECKGRRKGVEREGEKEREERGRGGGGGGAYGKAGNRNEMETGNGNWKWKLETEMGTKNAPITGAMFFFIVYLVISLVPGSPLAGRAWDFCILLSNGYMTALLYESCFVCTLT